MRSEVIIGMVTAFALATLCCAAGRPQDPQRTTADGVYTAAQADRGAQVIQNYGCRNCHGPQLEGGADEQPQLVGEEFVASWTGRKVAELQQKITTMPADQDDPYHVKPAAATDVVAYLLQQNGYPEGAAELPNDQDVLKQISIVAPGH